jgi:hypothetical protein
VGLGGRAALYGDEPMETELKKVDKSAAVQSIVEEGMYRGMCVSISGIITSSSSSSSSSIDYYYC